MFFQAKPVPVHLRQIYHLTRSPHEHAVAANMAAGTPHSFTLSVKKHSAVMTVDNRPESASTFSVPTAPIGYVSLASNATEADAGAYRYVKLRVDGKVVFDIDFRQVRSVEELEPYFDCYYFSDIDRDHDAVPAPIKQYWGFNERGHLRCIRERTDSIPINDCGPICMLTFRHPPITDFEIEVGFEQCWRRYGVVFGCDKQKFPYYAMLKTFSTSGIQGAFAYIGAHNGSCCMRGALRKSEDPNVVSIDPNENGYTSFCYRTNPPLAPLYRSDRQTTLPFHSLAFCVNGNMTYHFKDFSFTETAGSVVYLPPNIPCRLEGNSDFLIRVEFECAEPISLTPCVYHCERPDTIHRIFKELLENWYSTMPGKEYRALSVFYRILAEIARPSINSATLAVQVASQYIDTHFTDPKLTVSEVAKAADVSESYLYQLFRKAGEMSPKEYILHCRIHYACTLLKTRYYKVYEVAEKCGFSDPKYFMTAFKRTIGTSPGHYLSYKGN